MSTLAPAGAAPAGGSSDPAVTPLTRREVGGAVLGCALAVTLFLGPALFTGRYLSPADLLYQYLPWIAQPPAPSAWPRFANGGLYDSIAQFEPWLNYTARQVRQGQMPLWNPDNMLGAALAAVQVLAFLEYLGQSAVPATRGQGRGVGFTSGLRYLWTLVSPDLYGNPVHQASLWDPTPRAFYGETNIYPGLLVLLLAPLAGLARSGAHRRLALFLLLLGGLAAGIAYDAPLLGDAAPLLPLFDVATDTRLLLPAGWAPALLAALGVEALQNRLAQAPRRLPALLGGVAGGRAGAGSPGPGWRRAAFSRCRWSRQRRSPSGRAACCGPPRCWGSAVAGWRWSWPWRGRGPAGGEGFDPRATALLTAPLPPTQPLPAAPDGSAPSTDDVVTITRYTPQTVDLATRSPAPGLLVLSDLLFPGWTVTVDDQPGTIVAADHALRGVYLPAGGHAVRFTYAPLSFQLGVAVSAGAWLVVGLLVLGPWGRRRPAYAASHAAQD